MKLKDRQTRRIIRVFFNLQLRKKLVILEFKQLIKKLKENTERGIDGKLKSYNFRLINEPDDSRRVDPCLSAHIKLAGRRHRYVTRIILCPTISF